VLGASDIVSLHGPYFEKTHHLIGEKEFSAMKQGAILINTARGAVVDTRALLAALESGKLGGVGLDVLEGEEHITDELSFVLYGKGTVQDVQIFAQNMVLLSHQRVVATPHIAFYTTEALHRILDADITNIVSFFRGGVPVCDIMASKRLTSDTSFKK
jgi:D-lactate dehydrogenase